MFTNFLETQQGVVVESMQLDSDQLVEARDVSHGPWTGGQCEAQVSHVWILNQKANQ